MKIEIIAMAGLAEAAAMVNLLISWSALLVLALMIAISAGTSRNRIYFTSLVLTVITAFLFAPLSLPFHVSSAEALADPDDVYFLFWTGVLCLAWYGLLLLAIVSIPYHFWPQKIKKIRVRPIRVRPLTHKHYIQLKVKKAAGFLQDKHKVQITILFRGRENAHIEEGKKVMDSIMAQLQEYGKVISKPSQEARRMICTIAPK